MRRSTNLPLPTTFAPEAPPPPPASRETMLPAMSTTTTTTAQVTVSAATAKAAATRCHMFKIEGYERIKKMYGNGRSLDSCGFQAAGRTWRIQFFPNGNRTESTGYISLALKLEDDDAGATGTTNNKEDVLVEYQFSLVACHRGKPKCRPCTGAHMITFGKGRRTSSYPLFMKREEMERSGFVRDDCLAIRCDIAILSSPVEVKEQPAQVQDLEMLGVACDCKDETCKGYHLKAAFSLREAFLKLFLGCFRV